MHTNYSIPENRYYTKSNYQNFKYYPNIPYNNNDRFIGNGFLAPFILGGIAGNLIGRPNYYNRPIPVYFPNQPFPYPPYSNTNIYY